MRNDGIPIRTINGMAMIAANIGRSNKSDLVKLAPAKSDGARNNAKKAMGWTATAEIVAKMIAFMSLTPELSGARYARPLG